MSGYRASRAGALPAGGSPTVAGIRLPAGKAIVPDESYASGDPVTSPVVWIAEKEGVAGKLWEELVARFHETGLWPLALESLNGEDARPWFDGELDPGSSTPPGTHEAAKILAEWWSNVSPEDDDEESRAAVAPFGRDFPGLALPILKSSGAPGAVREAALGLEGHLGLVAVSRPADAPAALGWMGPVNHFDDMGWLATVLRSWEDRFGAYVVGIGFDTLTLGVERPPTDLKQALPIAAEHFAACSDNIYQGVGSIQAYAKELIGSDVWTFWWD